ncbi:MAG: hypothetical protein E7621_03545 [Ruminococcaceae bacterium]|nr:hypothetical protein [Oscillospiraceae bacterium]
MKKIIIALTLLSLAFSFTSCFKQTQTEINNDNGTTHSESNKGNEILETPTPVSVDYTVKYYDIITDEWKEFSSTANFEEQPDPAFFISEVSRLMGISVSVNNITAENDKMTIDFSASSPPLNGTGSYEENCILESICSTLFGVFPEINNIHITQDGKEYDSGHLSLSPDTPYATRTSEKLG